MTGNDSSTRQPNLAGGLDATQRQRVRETMTNHKLPLEQEGQEARETQLEQLEVNVPGMLDRSLQAKIGGELRAIYSDVAKEPVPDRFVKLLEELEAREKQR